MQPIKMNSKHLLAFILTVGTSQKDLKYELKDGRILLTGLTRDQFDKLKSDYQVSPIRQALQIFERLN